MGLLDISAKIVSKIGSGVKSYASAIPTIANTLFASSSKIATTVAPKIQAAASIAAPAIKSVFTTAVKYPKSTAAVVLAAPTVATAIYSDPKIIGRSVGAYVDLQKAGVSVASGKSTLIDATKKFVTEHPIATGVVAGAASLTALKNIPGLGSAAAVLVGDVLRDSDSKTSKQPTSPEGVISGSDMTTPVPTNGVFPIAPATKTLSAPSRSRKKTKTLNTQPVRVTNKIQIINAPMARSYSRSY